MTLMDTSVVKHNMLKTVVILQLVILGYMFRPLPGHHQVYKEIVLIKVHSLAIPMGSHCLTLDFRFLKLILMVKMLVSIKLRIRLYVF